MVSVPHSPAFSPVRITRRKSRQGAPGIAGATSTAASSRFGARPADSSSARSNQQGVAPSSQIRSSGLRSATSSRPARRWADASDRPAKAHTRAAARAGQRAKALPRAESAEALSCAWFIPRSGAAGCSALSHSWKAARLLVAQSSADSAGGKDGNAESAMRSNVTGFGPEGLDRPCAPRLYAAHPRRGHSSVGRAPEWHSGGRRFDSDWLHHPPPHDNSIINDRQLFCSRCCGAAPCLPSHRHIADRKLDFSPPCWLSLPDR